jgi:hypothetical protein
MVYVPAGVTRIGGGPEPDPLSRGIARPAPHPVAAIRQQSSANATGGDKRRLRKASKPTGNRDPSQNPLHRFVSSGETSDVEDTPVRTVTETVVVLPSATLEGVTLHVEFAGIPAQVKVAVPETFAAELSSKG